MQAIEPMEMHMQFALPGILPVLTAVGDNQPSSTSATTPAGEGPDGVTYRRVEPKYCEGCGALRLRFADDPRVLCPGCESTIGEAALSRRARRSA